MHKRLALISLISLVLVACIVSIPQPTPTPEPTPMPTATPPEPTPVADPTSTPDSDSPPRAYPWDWDDLEPYEQAMRETFAGDVARFANATRYLIDVEIDIDGRAFQGHALVRYTNQEREALSEIVLRLLPNTPGYGGAIDVSTIAVDGVAVEPTRRYQDSALYLSLAAPLAPGEALEIDLTFEGTLPTDDTAGYAQYGYYGGVLALPNFYPLIPVYDDEGWNVEVAPTYGDAVFSDTALYGVRVTLPADVVLAASGTIVGQQENGDGTVTYLVASGPMRDFNLVASAEYERLVAQVEDIVVTSYYLPEDRAGGERALDYATRSLEIYRELLGPYPFGELDVVATPTIAGGIEYPGLIVVAENLYEQSGGFFEFATVHEVAHQWWYSLVGSDQLDEPWLDEALTQYTSLLYFERRYGAQVGSEIVENVFQSPYDRLRENEQDMPAGLPVEDYPRDLYASVVYGKGPLFFHEMRQQVGDELFQAILRSYFEQFRYGVAYPQDLLAVAEQVSGQDLGPLYERWIAGGAD